MGKYKILLDTDIGTDMDDACAIAYLLARPDVELMGVTTVTGEALERAQLVSAICMSMGQPDIPVFPGLQTCILRRQYQYECPQKDLLKRWPHQEKFPERAALGFMQKTIRENPGEVILICIGPLSNAGILFQMDPELPSLLKGIFIQGGKYQQYDFRTWTRKNDDNLLSQATCGNLMEWNICIDGIASAIVFDQKYNFLRSVGAEITHNVSLTREEFDRTLSKKLPDILTDMSDAWLKIAGKDFDRYVLTYHDPVGVTTLFNDNICKFARGNVKIEVDSPLLRGFTYFEEDPEGRHEVAYEINKEEFFKEFSSVF
ncbi:MAG: nucleoside hydrolase [Clostridium sp.]|nr:nucleoside hydrolase [Clostridium sp.]